MKNARLALIFLALAACDAKPAPTSSEAEKPAAMGAEPGAAEPGSAEPGALPPGHPALPPGHPPANAPGLDGLVKAPAPTGPVAAGGLTWETQSPLERRAPKSSMRAAEYGVEGDPSSELAVFYFGADQGGSVDANITRWLGQLKQADGSDTAAKAKRSEREVGSVKVSLVEATGSYGGGMGMPGMPPPTPIDDAALLAAIAQGPQGAVFFKLTGPRASVEKARAAFDAMVGSIKPAP